MALKDERNTTLLTTVQLRRENSFLRAQNHQLKKEADEAFTFAKEALNEVIDTSMSWAVKAFKMLAEADDVPRYERRLEFVESLHKATVAGREPPEESSDDEEGKEMANPETQDDGADLPNE